ncbi:LacI family DNA-binding transcriptional regulator [Sinorhizobium alkalisoli]|uniref:LacI family DNA-binding transcriptional regulator n=1 Tax=Sinorhizobium alkalisoli TaxID=1752398 RepID=UPI00124E0D71|nr:LacI family DNA-binding transcriptional regulator [Sinorhizobium alkalisoli]MCA1491373.1 LacI family DNA-binding transcriptional regulator [Ensifer sp. NBAIM29]QFI70329.1 Transcriptional regulator AglR, LacI family [Sinorhizobium alkalisoli]
MITQREIARRARTSLKTVSRVINRDPLVNAETRARIEAIIGELGYTPSQAARMMRSQKSNVIGFISDRVATTSSSIELIRGAQDAAWKAGKQMMLFNVERNSETERHAEEQLAAFRAEAVIYATPYHQSVDRTATRIPCVLLNCFDAVGGYHAIVPDDYRLAYELTSIILDRSYRRPVFLNLPEDIVAAPLRARGFVEAGAARGLDLSGAVHTAVVRDSAGAPVFIADHILPGLMAAAARPDLILCGQDMLAMNVYFALADLGLKVGQDVGVASFDNLHPIAKMLQPGLSTMALPYYEMGAAAMFAAIEPDTHPPGIVRVSGRFVERASF